MYQGQMNPLVLERALCGSCTTFTHLHAGLNSYWTSLHQGVWQAALTTETTSASILAGSAFLLVLHS